MGEFILNKPLSSANIYKDDARGLEVVRKINIWTRSEASWVGREQMSNFEDNLSAKQGIILRYSSKPERGSFILWPSD